MVLAATVIAALRLVAFHAPLDTLVGPAVAPVDTAALAPLDTFTVVTRDTSVAGKPHAPAAATSDTTAPAPGVVRQLPGVEVRALLHDARATQTVRDIPTAALRAYPVDGLADLVALQPGVVEAADELHVRGGRAGETRVVLDGVTLNEPLRHRPMELPLLALRSAELVSGAPESRHAGALAGVLDLHTVEPGARPEGEWRWLSDGALDTRFDRVSARVSAPLPLLGLGAVVAGDATLDDTALPALRSAGRRRIAGLSFGWRAENRMLGYVKLAPIAGPRRGAVQLIASRSVHRPYDPAWSLEGWSGFDGSGNPYFSPVERPGLTRFRAADHAATTDDRRLATLLSASRLRGRSRGSLTLGWLRTRTATTVGGGHEIPDSPPGAFLDPFPGGDPFYFIAGDYPLYRVSGSDVVSLRGDAEIETSRGAAIRWGLGGSYENVWLDELDATLLPLQGFPIDSVRTYHARAPGAFAYAQGRWHSGGVVLNAGLRAEYFTPGPEGERQTLPGSASGHLSLLPRLGIAYPLSVGDVFSISYTRASQTPERDLLYDRRAFISNRQPLGNPALRPARLISYEAALKHLFRREWALQTSFFYRDAAHMPGTRGYRTPPGAIDLRYTDEDQASSAGFELSLVRDGGERRRIEAHYTFMRAWGFESRPEGDPYGPVLIVGTENREPISETPLSWDRRHAFVMSGLWGWGKRVTLAWSSSLGSPLPWTPKPRRQPADVTTVNSRRFGWRGITNLGVTWSPPYLLGLTFGLEARNLFDDRSERAATADGYPNPIINTAFDDYGAYRTETGLPGGAYWSTSGGTGHWVPVHDARLFHPPRTVRASVGGSW